MTNIANWYTTRRTVWVAANLHRHRGELQVDHHVVLVGGATKGNHHPQATDQPHAKFLRGLHASLCRLALADVHVTHMHQRGGHHGIVVTVLVGWPLVCEWKGVDLGLTNIGGADVVDEGAELTKDKQTAQ